MSPYSSTMTITEPVNMSGHNDRVITVQLIMVVIMCYGFVWFVKLNAENMICWNADYVLLSSISFFVLNNGM